MESTLADTVPAILARCRAEPATVPGIPSLRTSVVERLHRKFGWGQSKEKRLKFYQRLQRLADAHGVEVFDVISECVAESVGTDKPAHFFCRAVKLRLRERGLALVERPAAAEW